MRRLWTCLFLLLALCLQPARASDAQSLPALAAQVHHQIQTIMQGPDFVVPSSHTEWRRRHPQAAGPSSPGWHLNAAALARLLGILLWLVLGGVLVSLLLYWLRQPGGLRARIRPRAVPLAQVRELDRPTEAAGPLPDDVLAAAEASWAGGDSRQALSLLYRGALAALRQRGRLELPDSATEQESLARVRASQPREVVEGFALIVRAWLGEAYGARHPVSFAELAQVYRRCFLGAVA